KMPQLARAAQMGFEVPRTLITNDPEKARAFHAACDGQMIFKVLSDPSLAFDETVSLDSSADAKNIQTKTTFISQKELKQLEAIRIVPGQFQEHIPKKVEYRVTVVGDELFAAEIHSQEAEITRVDWREPFVQPRMTVGHLPADVRDRCMAFEKSYNLN